MILPDFVVVSFIRLREGCSVLLSACIETGGFYSRKYGVWDFNWYCCIGRLLYSILSCVSLYRVDFSPFSTYCCSISSISGIMHEFLFTSSSTCLILWLVIFSLLMLTLHWSFLCSWFNANQLILSLRKTCYDVLGHISDTGWPKSRPGPGAPSKNPARPGECFHSIQYGDTTV